VSATFSRRQVLSGLLTSAAVLPLTACTSDKPPEPVDPDIALRESARQRELALLAAYDAAIESGPALAGRLAGVRAEHEQHLVALTAAAPRPTGSAAQATVLSLPQLVALERSTAAQHAADALVASRSLAVVLASLAASEASHPVALT
jgi:hypothetical protein